MVTVTFLEAIKQAMFEEMERDPAVVLLGEDVGVYGGAFKTSEGLLERFGWERVIDTPISESAIIGAACGMSYMGLRPICGAAVHRFHRVRVQPDYEFRGQGALPVERAGADGDARAFGRRSAWRAVSFGESGNVFRAHAGTEGDLSFDAVRREGIAEGGGARQ